MATVERLGVVHLRDMVRGFRDALRTHAAELDRLNVYPVPDGDTGTNMARTLDAVVAELDAVEAAMAPTCQAISHGSLMGARGNSGVILSQLLRGMAAVLEPVAEIDPPTLATAMRAGATAAYAAVLRPVEGTILTVAREVAHAAERAAAAGATMVELLETANTAGRQALERTPELLPVLRDAGVVDAGGAGYLLFLEAALHVLDGRPLPAAPEAAPRPERPAAQHLAGTGLRYEVMFFLDLPDRHIDDFKRTWGELGDSIVVVGGDGFWNCHVHTDDIGAAIEAALEQGGRPRGIRVTDLHEQGHGAVPLAEGIRTSAVVVATGVGLTSLFRRLGAVRVVAGGQSANPSTAELLAAVDDAPTDAVVVLPNNANVVAVANQVQALTVKQVVVLPTRSVPEGLSAMVAYRPDAGIDDNASAMTEAAATVVVGELTRAVRDASSPAGEVRAGDWIGLEPGAGVVAVAAGLEAAAMALLGRLLGPGHELVTVVEGEDADPAATEALRSWLGRAYPEVDVEVHRGGQPLYPYLFGIE